MDDELDSLDELREVKRQLRSFAEARRQQLPIEQRQSASELICQHTVGIIDNYARSITHQPTILAYIPFRSEVDITPLIRHCWEANYKLAVPKVDKRLLSMEAYEIHSFVELEPGAWGILEPSALIAKLTALHTIDIIIIPGLAYNREGSRLGYGSGIYDRFISRYDALGLSRPLMLGVCFDIQLHDSIPTEQHDLRVDRIITEEAVYDIDH